MCAGRRIWRRLLALLCVSGGVWILLLVFRSPNYHPVAVSEWTATGNKTDPYIFHYLINNDPCRDRQVDLLTLVHSAPDHAADRRAIRRSWGATEGLIVIFLLGAVADRRLKEALEEENRLYQDLVQGDFVDSYRNLTRKHVMGLAWAGRYCPRARRLLKMDDDIFVEIFRFQQLSSGIPIDHSLSCYLQRSVPVVRDLSSKWYVSELEYPNSTFPPYCSGWAYLTRPRTALLLARTARRFPYFWVDDVHLTGTVAAAAGVALRPLNDWFSLEAESLARWTDSSQPQVWSRVFGPTWGDQELMVRAHRKARLCHRLNCSCCWSEEIKVTAGPVYGLARRIHLR